MQPSTKPRDPLVAAWSAVQDSQQSAEPIFEARYIQQQTQCQAAGKLGMRRTTLAYLERRMRRHIDCLAQRLES